MVSPSPTSENLWPFPAKGDGTYSQDLENFEDLEELEDDEDDCLDLKEIEAWLRTTGVADEVPQASSVKGVRRSKKA